MDINHLSTEVSRFSKGFRSSQKPTQQFNEINFFDVLDAFNPLNHIPVISSLREDANPVLPIAKMTGGLLIGGPVGFAMSAIDLVVKEASGKSMLGNALETVFAEGSDEPPVRLAHKRYQSIADANKRHFHTWNV